MKRSVFLNLILISLLTQLSGFSCAVAASFDDEPNATESIKSKVKSLEGKNVKVKLLRSGKTVKGVIFDITDKDFKVGHRLDSVSPTVRFEDVVEIQKTKTRWWLVFPVAAGVVIVGLFFYQSQFD